MLNFEWYRSFIAVYRSGTVTGAAETRFLTQPAISQHLSALESALGHALFQRTPRKMLPTEYGKALYSRVAPALDGLERVSAKLRDTSITELPTIKLGTPLDYFYQLGFDRLRHARFRLQLELGETNKMIDSLSRGKLDAVIATQQIDATNIDYLKIDREDFCLVSSIEITLPERLRKSSVQIDAIEKFLLAQNWISYSADLPIIRRFWHVAFKQRPNIEPVMILPSLGLIRKAIESGHGISVLPRYICQSALNQGKLKLLWEPQQSISNDLWIATRKADRNKIAIEQLISLMRCNDEISQ